MFHGQVRAGAPGSVSKDIFDIRECSTCTTRRLVPIPAEIDAFYESSQYRDTYNDSHDPERLTTMHRDIRLKSLERLDPDSVAGKTVVDFGCAEGGFLSLLSEVASRTIGIEPARCFHPYLKSRGHEVFSYGRDFLEAGGTADVAVSFSVLEHVPDPVGFLREMHAALVRGGRLVLSTPNVHDILDDLAPDAFRRFNYRTAHLYYFSSVSLRFLLMAAGFQEIRIEYLHLYDLSNLLAWYRDEQPTGLGRIPLFDERINRPWRRYLEETGRASDIWVEARA